MRLSRGLSRFQADLCFGNAPFDLGPAIAGLGLKHMGIRFPGIALSKNMILVASQLVVNVLLVAWIYNEYLHNTYMQEYLGNIWTSIGNVIVVAAGFAVGAGAVIVFYTRGRLSLLLKSPGTGSMVQAISTTTNLEALDVCPFCETPLKTISEGRLQCRSCRRYYKSSLPKAEAMAA